VLGYVHADIVEPACVRIPVPRQAVGRDGTITDLAIRARIAEELETLAAEVVAREGEVSQ
jgi:chromate reductase, NAD(P)H dehydrogenase (quinone)